MTEQNFTTRTLYHSDNLPVLRGMNSGTVDLIATDPPFNKSKDFHATPDSLADGASPCQPPAGAAGGRERQRAVRQPAASRGGKA